MEKESNPFISRKFSLPADKPLGIKTFFSALSTCPKEEGQGLSAKAMPQWMQWEPCTEAHARWHYLELKSKSHPCRSWEATADFLLVNKVLDALEIPVPVHRADAELKHHYSHEKQPKRSSYTQALGIFVQTKQNFVTKKKLVKEKLT